MEKPSGLEGFENAVIEGISGLDGETFRVSLVLQKAAECQEDSKVIEDVGYRFS